MKHLALTLALSCSLTGCTGLLSGLGAPPQAPAAVQSISRTALDFALNSFDAALYGLDFALDSGRLVPGSDVSRRIAAAGRQVMGFLGAAEAARSLGSSATYEEAFANAKTALDEFRSLFPTRVSFSGSMSAMTAEEREAVLDRLEGNGSAGLSVVR